MFPVIDGQKIIRARGDRTQREIVEASENAFTVQQLSSWERGLYRPNDQNLAALLVALDVNYEDITIDYDKAMAQAA